MNKNKFHALVKSARALAGMQGVTAQSLVHLNYDRAQQQQQPRDVDRNQDKSGQKSCPKKQQVATFPQRAASSLPDWGSSFLITRLTSTTGDISARGKQISKNDGCMKRR